VKKCKTFEEVVLRWGYLLADGKAIFVEGKENIFLKSIKFNSHKENLLSTEFNTC
jgi:hypothetical protein